MIIQTEKRRQSKFSFSRSPQLGPTQSLNLQSFKNRFKGQMALVINNKPLPNDNEVQLQKFLSRINIELNEEELQSIKFDLKEYHEKYKEGDILGEGCIGLVKTVIRNTDGYEFACKTVKTDAEEIVKNMILEFKNLKKLQHSNIVQMEELYVQWNDGFQATGTVCVIMEKVQGREMFEVIQQQKNYSESTARVLFKQILEAIKFMHDHYCCHRDLKPNNILCLEKEKIVKIADFNVSKFNDNYKEFGNLDDIGKIEMWTYTGTVAFSAPEIFSGGIYNEQVDLWSAGVILYVMLSGKLPFDSEYLNDLIEKICSCKYEMQGEIWNNISDQAKNLIENLLQHDPQKRLTPEEALNHIWITKELSQKDIPRDQLQLNMQRLLSVKPTQLQLQQKREQKIKQICYLFGAGEMWKRHSLGISTDCQLAEEFKKCKSIDIVGLQTQDKIKVIEDQDNKGVYHIDCPFSDSD